MFLDYKLTRYEGKGFLHRDITGEMWVVVGVGEIKIRVVQKGH